MLQKDPEVGEDLIYVLSLMGERETTRKYKIEGQMYIIVPKLSNLLLG